MESGACAGRPLACGARRIGLAGLT
jgi:hypothetical protein